MSFLTAPVIGKHTRRAAAIGGPLLVAAVLATGCGSPSIGASTDADDLGQHFGSCEYENVDHPDTLGVVGGVESWYQVDSLDPVTRSITDTAHTTESALTVVPVAGGGVRAGDPTPETFRFHGSFMPGLKWAVDTPGADAFIGIYEVEDRPNPTVAFLAVRAPAGGFFFAGSCQDLIVRQGLAEYFDDELLLVFESMIGLTGDELKEAMAAARS